MKTLKLLFIILIICGIYILLKYTTIAQYNLKNNSTNNSSNNLFFKLFSNKHLYWDIQPVDRSVFTPNLYDNNYDNKIIKKKDIKSEFIVDNNYYIDVRFSSNDYPTIDILNFIVENYSQTEPYNINKLKWLISYNKTVIVVLYNNILNNDNTSTNNSVTDYTEIKYGIIIGTIFGKITTLMINNKQTNVLNVEMLCIKETERNKRIAPILIDKMVNIYKELDVEFPIFTIDTKPLPFKYFSKVTYYHLFINNTQNNNSQNNNKQIINNIQSKYKQIQFKQIINIDDIKRAYVIILSLLSKYKIYEIINESSLHSYIDNNNCHLYSDNDEKSFIIYTTNIYVNNHASKSSNANMNAAVIHIIESAIYDKTTLLYNFTKYLQSKCNIDIITCLNISNNDIAIKDLNFIKGIETFYHVYNYTLSYININDNALSFA